MNSLLIPPVTDLSVGSDFFNLDRLLRFPQGDDEQDFELVCYVEIRFEPRYVYRSDDASSQIPFRRA